MKNYRIHGDEPIEIAVLHGGPGAFGSVVDLAVTLSQQYGVLEPFQTTDTIMGQVEEVRDVIVAHSTIPVTLIGHSWGAWLAYLFAAIHAELVSKIILVGSGPYEQHYVPAMQRCREERLTDADRQRIGELSALLMDPSIQNRHDVLMQIGDLFSRIDNVDLLAADSHEVEEIDPAVFAIQPSYFHGLLQEAMEMRASGVLLDRAQQITCPVVAIHGDYDPHPYEGVRIPLQQNIGSFTFYLLHDCGHEPWLERHGKHEFYRILEHELH